ncbi:MAG: (Fe-S)-binding protein [Planctomycetes bacterium]|nr:(Fe-S)-binding protein [Planctomycetota bacterium]
MPRKMPYYVEPYDLVGRPARFLEAFAAILEHSTYGPVIDFYARLKTRCARCPDLCPVYQVTGEKRDIPCERSDMLLEVYRRYFTTRGKMKGRLLDDFELTDEYLDDMAESYWRCTACRRCKLECPMGIDHGLITHLARWILSEIGIVPKALVVSVREQLEGETKNTSAIPVPALQDNCAFLEDEIREMFGYEAKFPIDVKGAEWVFFPAVSDYLLEADTLMGIAVVMQITGGSWTIGTGDFDGINYGLFYSDRMLGRIVRNEAAEVRRLEAKGVLAGECGHATRAAKGFIPTYAGGENAPPVMNIMQYTHRVWKEGKLPLLAGAIKERVTYHDPCNIARSGWILEEPRDILKHICADYVDMFPNRRENYCCGGGGGSVSIDEIREFRTKTGGKAKADQIRATGAKYVVAPCANCKKQVREVCEDHGLSEVETVGLHDLILKAIDWDRVKNVKKETA